MQFLPKAGLTLALLATAAFAPMASQAQTTITFDDFTGVYGAIPTSYQGLTWSDWGYINGSTYPTNPSGYQAGVVSPNNVAFGGYPSNSGATVNFSAASPFTLTSLYLTSAWNDNMEVTITGKSGGVAVAGDLVTETLSATAPTQYTFNWSGLDEVDFTPFGGTQHAAYLGKGEFFAMDNLVINGTPATPPPTSLTPETPAGLLLPLALLPMGLIAFHARRKKAQ